MVLDIQGLKLVFQSLGFELDMKNIYWCESMLLITHCQADGHILIQE